MALKTVLESLDGIDDAFKGLYTETDGKFILQLEGVDFHPEVLNLKNAYERVKKDKATAIQERDALKERLSDIPEDFDADKWAKLKDGKADEAAAIKLRKELETERDDWKSKATEAEGKLHRFAVERDLADALTVSGITDASLTKGARAILSPMVKSDDDGKAVVETDMGPIPIADYVPKWVAGEGKAFVTPAKGGDRKGSDGSGQSTKKWSEMSSGEKVRLNRSDPDEYKRVLEADQARE